MLLVLSVTCGSLVIEVQYLELDYHELEIIFVQHVNKENKSTALAVTILKGKNIKNQSDMCDGTMAVNTNPSR